MAEKEKKSISPSKLRRRKKRIIWISILSVLIIAAVIFFFVPLVKVESPQGGGVSAAMSGFGNTGIAKRITLYEAITSEGENAEKVIMTAKPYISTIELTVSGSGTVEPLDRYEIMSLVSGDVVAAPFEEGDMVNEDDVVFVIDHEEQDKSIESAKNSLTKAKIRNKIYLDEEEFEKTLAKYTVRAEEDGIISDFSLAEDDKVTANGKLGTIRNFDKIIATVPFNAAQFAKIEEGDLATVYLYPSMYVAEGTVTYKSYKTSGSIGGAVVHDVEITFDGSTMTLTDTAVSATVHTTLGDVESPSSGTLKYDDPVNIFAEVSGEVKSIPHGIKNGAKVKKGDILFTIDTEDFLESKTLAEFDYNDLEINLENAIDRLENYNIKSPISGTVITKNTKKGDTVSSGNNGSTLMVIADMSAMKFIFQADETDIGKIEVGQEVKVTAEAVENKTFKGIVESVATEGASSNGVSYYNVEVVVSDYGQNDESGMLRSGMNVSAEIVYEKAENALCVPVSAVTSMGSESYVFIKGEAPSVSSDINKGEFEAETEMDEKRPDGVIDTEKQDTTTKNDRSEIIKERIKAMTPEGFKAVKVETGATNGVIIAILSGIDENTEVYIAENNDVQTPVSFGGQMGFTGGGMYGGMPGGTRGGQMGGMPGGMGGMRR